VPDKISTAWFLAALVVFLFKHLFADFILQTSWMANGKEREQGWIVPLTVHAGIHAATTALIFYAWLPVYFWMAGVDFAVHFVIDRAKGETGRALKVDNTQSVYWWIFGVDQTLHHLTHLGFALLIAVARS